MWITRLLRSDQGIVERSVRPATNTSWTWSGPRPPRSCVKSTWRLPHHAAPRMQHHQKNTQYEDQRRNSFARCHPRSCAVPFNSVTATSEKNPHLTAPAHLSSIPGASASFFALGGGGGVLEGRGDGGEEGGSRTSSIVQLCSSLFSHTFCSLLHASDQDLPVASRTLSKASPLLKQIKKQSWSLPRSCQLIPVF